MKLEEAGRRQAEAERKLTEAHRGHLQNIATQQRTELERLADEHEAALRWLEDKHRQDLQLQQDTSELLSLYTSLVAWLGSLVAWLGSLVGRLGSLVGRLGSLVGRFGSLVAKALDLQLASCEFNSRPQRCRVTTLGKLCTSTCLSRSQWFSDGMIDCGMRGHGQLCLSRQPLRCTALGTAHHTCSA